jgi:hypothetical protein
MHNIYDDKCIKTQKEYKAEREQCKEIVQAMTRHFCESREEKVAKQRDKLVW